MDEHIIQQMFAEMGLETEEQRRKFNSDLFTTRKDGSRHVPTDSKVYNNTLTKHEHHA